MTLQFSVEAFIALIVAILGGSWAVWNKLDHIWKAIGEIRENFVKHQTCAERRQNCPCVKELAELRKNFHEHELGEIELTKTQVMTKQQGGHMKKTFLILVGLSILTVLFGAGCKSTKIEYDTDPAHFYKDENGRITQPIKSKNEYYGLNKTLASRTVVVGLEVEMAVDQAPAKGRIGYVTHEGVSALDCHEATLKKEYDDVSIWGGSGDISTEITIAKTLPETPPSDKSADPKETTPNK